MDLWCTYVPVFEIRVELQYLIGLFVRHSYADTAPVIKINGILPDQNIRIQIQAWQIDLFCAKLCVFHVCGKIVTFYDINLPSNSDISIEHS